MKVILLQDLAGIGKKNDIVNVSDGHAFNYLIPRKMAEQASPAKERELEIDRAQTEEERERYTEEIRNGLAKLKDKTVEIEAKVNEKGRLFAGIEKSNLISALKEQEGVEVEEEMVDLEAPIKEAGEHSITFKVGESNIDVNFLIQASK